MEGGYIRYGKKYGYSLDKLVQRLADADACGPFLQGFAHTVVDLSRGPTVDDVVGASVMTAVHALG